MYDDDGGPISKSIGPSLERDPLPVETWERFWFIVNRLTHEYEREGEMVPWVYTDECSEQLAVWS